MYIWIVSVVLVTLASARGALALPSVANVSAPTTVPRYEKFEATFDVSTVATNPYWPYDASPPTGMPSGVGVTVEGLFSNDNWATTMVKPAFYYQPYYHEKHPNGISAAGEWAYPRGDAEWCMRFAPHAVGTWKFKIRVTDSSGTTVYPDGDGFMFTCVPSDNPGPIRVSQADKRYFEYANGKPFVTAIGLDDNGRGDVALMEADYASLSSNGVKLIRHWWQTWGSIPLFGLANTNRVGGNGLSQTVSSEQHLPGRMLSYVLGRTYPENEGTVRVYCLPGKSYRVSVWVRTTEVVGTGNYGVALWAYDEKRLFTAVTSRLVGTNEWTQLSATVASTLTDYSLVTKLINENATGGSVYFSDFSIREVNDDGTYGPELVDRPHADVFTYYPQFTAWKCDRQIEICEATGVRLKIVAQEKQDPIWGRIQDDYTFAASDDLAQRSVRTYASPTSANRRLQSYYWRWLVARFGHSVAVHSWEMFNEADPYDGRHHEAALSFAKFVHDNNPNPQMVSTSCWHSFPSGEFWGNPLYQELDYADIHRYISVGGWNTAYYSTYDADGELNTIPRRIVDGGLPSGTAGHSVRLTAPDDNDSAWSSRQLCKIPISPSHTYRLGVWSRGSDLVWLGPDHNPARPMLLAKTVSGWHNASITSIYVGAAENRVGTFGWEQHTTTFTAEPNAFFLHIWLFLTNTATGTGWFDDITLEDLTVGKIISVPNGDFEHPDPLYEDSAFEHYALAESIVSMDVSRRQVSKPVIRGETGFYDPDHLVNNPTEPWNEQYFKIDYDTANLWLKKKVWAHIAPSGMIDVLYWRYTLDKYNRWFIAKPFFQFIQSVPINNGSYHDAQAVATSPIMRAWGQKDLVNNRAHLWIDNKPYTWKNIVDGVAVPPASGTVTISGFKDGSYNVEWWDTTSGAVTRQETVQCSGGMITLPVSNLVSDVACKVYPVASISPKIQLSISVSEEQPKPGQTVTITVTYSNTGDSLATNVQVKAAVPAEMSYVAGSGEASGGVYNAVDRSVTWTIADFAAGETGTRTFQARVN